jgi:capsular polysaccharide transport system permease protein
LLLDATEAVLLPRPSLWRRVLGRLSLSFVLTTLLPTLAAVVYYGLIASDQYISESRFVVRNPQRTVPGGLGALLQGTVFSRSQDDTYSVHDFIRSRDALREIDQKLKLRQAFSRKDIDFFNRFPGPDFDGSFEAFHRYYQSRVGIEYDNVSSISVLRVASFTARDAHDINDLLLQMGERLVNNLNIRSREDLIQVATQEVTQAEAKVSAAAAALSSFRSRRGVLDPDRQGTMQLQGVGKLQEELIQAQAQLAQLRRLSPDNPQIPSLASRVQILQRSAADERAKVVGHTASLSAQLPDYDRLVLEKAFADRQLASALTSLETARNEAHRKQLYLERLVQPNLPDVAVEPRRIRGVLTVLAFSLVLWGVVSMVLAGIREHSD